MGHDKTGHNQMLKRRRVKQLRKKRLVKSAKRAQTLRVQEAHAKAPAA